MVRGDWWSGRSADADAHYEALFNDGQAFPSTSAVFSVPCLTFDAQNQAGAARAYESSLLRQSAPRAPTRGTSVSSQYCAAASLPS
jgi:hypothetical protein